MGDVLRSDSDSVRPDEWSQLVQTVSECKTQEKLKALGFDPLTVGFANSVCAARIRGHHVVIKTYTDLVFVRLEHATIGVVDVHAGQSGIGPAVLHSTPQGLITEFLPGRTLEERDVHKGDLTLVGRVAEAVAKCHMLPIPEVMAGTPMLWRTIDKMLEVANRRLDLMPPGLTSLEVVINEVKSARRELELHNPMIVLGHGDLKPSNVIEHEGRVTLIDFELGGPNYRGFDLMKMFRTAGTFSEDGLRHFLQVYSESSGSGGSDTSVEELMRETKLFLPLTWLEAAVFFLILPQFKPDETQKWNDLAIQRWGQYEQSKGKAR